MSNTARFRVDPELAVLLGEGYRSSEDALKELIDNASSPAHAQSCRGCRKNSRRKHRLVVLPDYYSERNARGIRIRRLTRPTLAASTVLLPFALP